VLGWEAGSKHARLLGRAGESRPNGGSLALRSRRFDDRSDPQLRRRPARLEPEARTSKYAIAGLPDAGGESGFIDWDDVVDVVCTGAGAGGLAAALAASISGLRVFVADALPGAVAGGNPDAGTLPGRLGVTDSATAAYLDCLTQDIGPLAPIAGVDELPVRVVDGLLRPAAGRGVIATFSGSALRDWSARCLASSHGLLSTRVGYPGVMATFGTPGGTIEAAVVGAVNIDLVRPAAGLDAWLVAQARDRGITVRTSSSLKRLVFEAGEVVGAVIDTPAGSRSVRARRGVVLETGCAPLNPGASVPAAAAPTTAQVALVTRTASRFARLELLVPPRG
jgi:hypothetical protein